MPDLKPDMTSDFRSDLTSVLPAAPAGWHLYVLYKSVRHIYFRIYPGQNQVKITVPRRISSSGLDAAIQAKSQWLLNKISVQRPIPGADSELKDEGECRFKGRTYPLVFRVWAAPPRVLFDSETGITVYTRPGTGPEKKAGILSQWMRQCLKREIRILLDRWEPVMRVEACEFGVKKMKTRWGSCNTRAGRVWINLALIRMSSGLLEYVLVHELVHLLEPSHNHRFYDLMDRFLPRWKRDKAELDRFSPMG